MMAEQGSPNSTGVDVGIKSLPGAWALTSSTSRENVLSRQFYTKIKFHDFGTR